MSEFTVQFEAFQKNVFELAKRNGFWEIEDKLDEIPAELRSFILDAVSGKKISLMHSELSEALEGIRAGDPADDKIADFTSAEAELADCVIRIMDFAQARGLRLAEAIEAKHNFNCSRPYKHGKKF